MRWSSASRDVNCSYRRDLPSLISSISTSLKCNGCSSLVVELPRTRHAKAPISAMHRSGEHTGSTGYARLEHGNRREPHANGPSRELTMAGKGSHVAKLALTVLMTGATPSRGRRSTMLTRRRNQSGRSANGAPRDLLHGIWCHEARHQSTDMFM